jgi:hypothetical protein
LNCEIYWKELIAVIVASCERLHPLEEDIICPFYDRPSHEIYDYFFRMYQIELYTSIHAALRDIHTWFRIATFYSSLDMPLPGKYKASAEGSSLSAGMLFIGSSTSIQGGWVLGFTYGGYIAYPRVLYNDYR